MDKSIIKTITSCASRGRDKVGGREQRLELRSTQYTNCVTSFDKDNMLLIQYGPPVKF